MSLSPLLVMNVLSPLECALSLPGGVQWDPLCPLNALPHFPECWGSSAALAVPQRPLACPVGPKLRAAAGLCSAPSENGALSSRGFIEGQLQHHLAESQGTRNPSLLWSQVMLQHRGQNLLVSPSIWDQTIHDPAPSPGGPGNRGVSRVRGGLWRWLSQPKYKHTPIERTQTII